MAVNTEEVFKKIEKQNGKIFARVMRGDDSAIPEGSTPFQNVNLLDTPDLVNMLRYAGKDPNDAIELIPVIKERRDIALRKIETKQESFEDPIKLLDMAGYNAFYVKTLEQQNSIKKYFKPSEKLCTFRDPDRYKKNYIINAVKKNVDDIKRSSQPQREDEYGTSVISIQILKTGGAISIKNRYNHTVTNPDHTFNDNPDNIIPGLSAALKHKFGVDFVVSNSKIPKDYIFIHNQLIHYNYEINNVYFGDNFYLNGSDITELDEKHEVMLDNIILDTDFGKKARSVLVIPDGSTGELVRIINDEIAGCKVTKTTEKGETIITIIDENKQKKELARVKDGQITSLHLYKTTELGEDFLSRNKTLRELDAPKLETMGCKCFFNNEILETLNIPELKKMGSGCFFCSKSLKELNAPKLEKMDDRCFYENKSLKELNAPKLEIMEESCFHENEILETLNIPELKEMGRDCFCNNKSLKELSAPKLEIMGDRCFQNSQILETLNIPELKKMGGDCFSNNKSLKELNAPKLKIMYSDCFYKNKSLKELNAPKLEIMGCECFRDNAILETLNTPELKEMYYDCFYKNKSLKELNAPKLEGAERHAFIKRFLRRKKLRQTAKNVLFKLGIRKAKQPDASIPQNNSIQEER